MPASCGNVASQSNAKGASNPKEAAKQGLRKMKADRPRHGTGSAGPQERPDLATLRRLGFTGNDASVLAQAARQAPAVLAACYSASQHVDRQRRHRLPEAPTPRMAASLHPRQPDQQVPPLPWSQR